MAVFSGARTQDLMGLSIRLAGFEIRDTLGWVYGSGMPKSLDVSKAIDKGQALSKSRAYEFTEWMRSTGITAREINEATDTNMGSHYLTDRSQPAIATADLFDKLRPLLPEVPERIERLVAERTGIEWTDYVKREVVGQRSDGASSIYSMGENKMDSNILNITTPATSEAQRWDGWGTSLKPAIEPIILARKPLDGTVANNVLAHGVGGLNIDACRVSHNEPEDHTKRVSPKLSGVYGDGTARAESDSLRSPAPAGRFPANVLLDEHAAKEMDKQSGVSTSVRSERGAGKRGDTAAYGEYGTLDDTTRGHSDSGGASRFFPVFKYQAKAPKKERPVIYKNNCECEEWQSQQKDTTESTATAETSWSTSTSGNSTTEKCQRDTTSTTSTMTSSTTGSKTSNALAGSTISESTQDAKSEMVNGGNHAESAESLSQSEQNTGISVKRDGHSTGDAGHATSEKSYTTSKCEKCGEPKLKVQHATVKPLALMSWLVELITPPGGVVLDPFAGSGTTLQAAINKGFTPIGIEQDADYIKLIEKRLGQ